MHAEAQVQAKTNGGPRLGPHFSFMLINVNSIQGQVRFNFDYEPKKLHAHKYLNNFHTPILDGCVRFVRVRII